MKNKVKSRLCLFANLLFYVVFAALDGPVWCRDSGSYATMDYTREPLYCTFLWLMRKIFGETIMVHGWDLTDRVDGKAAAEEPLYLMAVIICQAVVTALVVWYLVKTCYSLWASLKRSGAMRVAAVANAVMWAVELLNRFGAKRGSAYFQSIMTEGFGIPFYILFLLLLFRYLQARLEGSGKWKSCLVGTAVMMTVCTSHHKQLGITILIFAVSALGLDLLEMIRHRKRGVGEDNRCNCGLDESKNIENGNRGIASARQWLLRDMAVLACVGGMIFVIGHAYNLSFHGVWSFHTGSADKIDSTLLYTAAEEDAELFDRYADASGEYSASDLKELFLEIEEELTEQGLRYVDIIPVSLEDNASAAKASSDAVNAGAAESDGGASEPAEEHAKVSWVELCSHYADSYDIIGFEVLDPLVSSFVSEQRPDLTSGSMEFAIAEDTVCRELMQVLIHQNPKRLIWLWLNNIRKGFVNTVLRVTTVLNWASLVLWTGYIGLLGYLCVDMHRRTRLGKRDGCVCGRSGTAIGGERYLPSDNEIGIALLAGLVLLGTFINSVVVGAIIFPQTRYMIYNMGLFYVCGIMMAGAVIGTYRVKSESGE